MSAEQLIAEYKALSPDQRQRVVEAILGDESWIPESFCQGMQDIADGRVISTEDALREKPADQA